MFDFVGKKIMRVSGKLQIRHTFCCKFFFCRGQSPNILSEIMRDQESGSRGVNLIDFLNAAFKRGCGGRSTGIDCTWTGTDLNESMSVSQSVTLIEWLWLLWLLSE